jgi:hypothetical protein
MKNRLPDIIAGLSIVLAILVMFHQQLTNGYFFQWRALVHYETVVVGLVVLAFGIFLGTGLAGGAWFSWRQFFHHEAVEACLILLAAGLLLGKYVGKFMVHH